MILQCIPAVLQSNSSSTISGSKSITEGSSSMHTKSSVKERQSFRKRNLRIWRSSLSDDEHHHAARAELDSTTKFGFTSNSSWLELEPAPTRGNTTGMFPKRQEETSKEKNLMFFLEFRHFHLCYRGDKDRNPLKVNISWFMVIFPEFYGFGLVAVAVNILRTSSTSWNLGVCQGDEP